MIIIKIPFLPKMQAGGHGSWKREAASRRLWKKRVAQELVGLAPPKPFEKIAVKFVRCSSSEPDDDNLIISFKPLRDALVTYGFVVDDDRQHMTASYAWEKAPAGKGHVRLEITSEILLP